ncbi:MAG: MFS transporter [Acidimicrobiales bacterium]|nr:MFS transporter [Acidimicrobiales bacterium]
MNSQNGRAVLRSGGAASEPSGQVLTVLLTSVAYFMVTLDALVVVTALPSIHRSLGGGIGTLQWTISAYTIVFGAGILTAAALGDRLGRRRVYVVGLALFTMASAACALAPNAEVLVACRAVQGMGAAIVMPLGLTLLTTAFPPERRGAVVGIWGGIAGLAVASGPLIGGAITQGLNWHWIFWVNVPIGVVAAFGARLRLEESWGPRARLDIPALVLVSGGVGVLIWGLVQGGQQGWGSDQNLTGLILGALLLLGFVLWEARAPEPMIPLGLFRQPTFAAAVGTQFLMASAIFSAAFLTSQFFQFALGDSPLATGLRFLSWTATPLLIAPLAGALSDKIGARALIVPGLAMQGIGFAWIVHLAGGTSSYGSYVVPFIVAGVGISMALPCVTVAGLNAVPPPILGKAAGTLNTVQQFGAAFGVAIVTAVFNSKGSLASPPAVTDGYRPALLVAAGLSVVGAVVALGIRRSAHEEAPVSTSSRERGALDLVPALDVD